ncbi:hypothetical protein B0J13DRAFT_641782 [Dactylonectria estremocensis]|uniref:Uncharacterized protein n=1 Tax=Dactylonectria estremocensis TaxID=1079267 RepID=A0A9P9ITV5_9HYPO|nr:hypothetical protein B0J13DRAFT_641782 [Dactylonectria estremocensis]
MIDKSQCPTHTRTPWGKNDHRYDHRIRYLAMGILCTVILTVIIVAIVFSAMNYRWDDADSVQEYLACSSELKVPETIARTSALTTQTFVADK